MKEYGLTDEELVALGENPETKQELEEQWNGDFEYWMDFWF